MEADNRSRIIGHLRHEAKGCSAVVLWLDCDREGENICFEVIRCVKPAMAQRHGQQIYRAKFSAVNREDIVKAMASLGEPNKHESDAVDARQELDLKVGVVFTRMLTRALRDAARRRFALPSLRLLSFGPCQTPTLW